jgi:hypothetical protein
MGSVKYPIGTKVLNKDGTFAWELVRYSSYCVEIRHAPSQYYVTVSICQVIDFYTDSDRAAGRIVKLPTKAILEEYFSNFPESH